MEQQQEEMFKDLDFWVAESHTTDGREPNSFLTEPPLVFVTQRRKFPENQIKNMKHVIYNLLVDGLENTGENVLVKPIVEGGLHRGFELVNGETTKRKLAELYAFHVRKVNLLFENEHSLAIRDLYKFYTRDCLQLMSKYFERKGRDKFYYIDIPLYVENDTLEKAEDRILMMRTKDRKNVKRKRGSYNK